MGNGAMVQHLCVFGLLTKPTFAFDAAGRDCLVWSLGLEA